MGGLKKIFSVIVLSFSIGACHSKPNPSRPPSDEIGKTSQLLQSEKQIAGLSGSQDSSAWGEKRWVKSRTNIRSSRSTDAPVVGKLNPGDSVKVDFLKDNWYAVFNMAQSVRAESLAVGYVYAPLLMPSSQEGAKVGVEASKEGEKAKRPPKSSPSEDWKRFLDLLKSIGVDNSLIVSVGQGINANSIEITVTNAWHIQSYQIRLQAAQNLWKMWASIRSPSSPDDARISIVDYNGNEVGGSRIWGGSLIWVQEQ